MSIHEQESRFSNREELEQIGNYRRFNFPAILALILGLCSATSLLAPNLWIVPVIAIAFGIAGLWLARRADNMGGTSASWIGMALALFFVSWAVSQLYFQRQIIYTEAKTVAKAWLQLVAAGDDKVAHQAMMHPSARQSPGLSVDEYYKRDKKARLDKNEIFEKPPASLVMQMGADANVNLVENVSQASDLQYGELIRQVYRVSAEGKEPVEAMLTITRTEKKEVDRPATWIVADIEPLILQ